MTRRRLLAGGLILGGSLVVLVALTRGPPPPSPNSGTFSFAALGDSPYYWFEDLQYQVVLDDIAAHDLSLVVHVGDILDGPCTDRRYLKTLEEFNRLPHPVIYTPGDNEWTDCWDEGDYPPLTQLARIRETFFEDPENSLGSRRVPLEHQGQKEGFAEFLENARWTHGGVLFSTFHLVGSGNGTLETPHRNEATAAEAARRLDAAVAWLEASFAEAQSTGAVAVVVAFHANPGFEDPEAPRRRIFDPFIATLEENAASFGAPVLVIHGDWHSYIVDRPVTSRTTLRHLDNVTRLQVPGSFDVGWVRVTVTPEAAEPFAFEPRVVPQWKLW